MDKDLNFIIQETNNRMKTVAERIGLVGDT